EPGSLRDHHLGISAIRMNARVSLVKAVHQIAISAELAIPTRTTEETNTYSLTNCPTLNTRAKGIDASDNFMSRYARPVDWEGPFHRAGIRVADTARLDANTHLARAGIDQRFHYGCEFSGFRYLDCSICCAHISSVSLLRTCQPDAGLLISSFSNGAGSILCRTLPGWMQRLKKFDQRGRLRRTQVLPISRHISSVLNDLTNQLIRRETDSNSVERRSALAAIAAQGMAVVTLLGLKDERALVLQRSTIFQILGGNRLAAPRVHYGTPGRVLSQVCQGAKRYRCHQDHKNGNGPAFPTLLALTGKERQHQEDNNAD